MFAAYAAAPLRSSATVTAEDGDLVLADPLTLLRILDAEPLCRSETEDADLALVLVAVDLQRRLADVLQRLHRRQHRLDLAEVHEAVRLPRLRIVGKVRGQQPLQRH